MLLLQEKSRDLNSSVNAWRALSHFCLILPFKKEDYYCESQNHRYQNKQSCLKSSKCSCPNLRDEKSQNKEIYRILKPLNILKEHNRITGYQMK